MSYFAFIAKRPALNPGRYPWGQVLRVIRIPRPC